MLGLHIGFTTILFVIATVCYWIGFFIKNKKTKGQLFTAGRWILTATSAIGVISILLILFAVAAIMSGHGSAHESLGFHSITIILIFAMTIWAWVIRHAKKEMNFYFLIGLLITTILLL